MTLRARTLVALMTVAMPAWPHIARAGDPPVAADVEHAKKLFFEGIAREDAGDWPGALDKFHRALSLRATPAIRFHVALCLEKTGRLVSAHAEFERTRDQALLEGTMSVVGKAREHLDALDARTPAIELRAPVPGTVVTVDGRTVDAKGLLRLDPGAHDVIAEATGYARFERRVVLEDYAPMPVVVLVVMPRIASEPPIVRPPPGPPMAGRSAVPLVVAGVGALALVSSSVMFILRAGTIRDLDRSCGPSRDTCPESARSLEDRAHAYNAAGNVLLISGAVLLSTGVIIYVASSRSDKAIATTLSPTHGGAHLTWSVTF